MVSTKDLLTILRCMAAAIEKNKEWLTDLDRPIGDSDHGINMARGFGEVEKKLSGLEGKDGGTILKTVGMTLVSTVGGSAGPLYGSAFMKAGMALTDKTEISMADFLDALDQAVDAVRQRGKDHAGCHDTGASGHEGGQGTEGSAGGDSEKRRGGVLGRS